MNKPEKSFIKTVIDTNVIISILIGKRLKILLTYIKSGKIKLVFSKNTFDEVVQVLKREKFVKYASEVKRNQFLKSLAENSVKVFPKEEIKDCRDVKDNIFLDCAVEGNANYLITGDNDLLDMNPYRNISIISPSKFIEILSPENEQK